MAAGERDRQGKKTDARVENKLALPRESTQKGRSKRRARGHSRDHTTSMQSEESRRVTDKGGRVEPTKRQARTEREVGLEVDGSGLRA